MKNYSQQVARLIFKCKWGKLSVTEQEELDVWLEEDAEHREIFNALWNDQQNYKAWHALNKYDSQRAFRSFSFRVGKQMYFSVGLRVAAVLLFALLGGIWIGYQYLGNEEQVFAVTGGVSSDSLKMEEVILTLGDGRKMMLSPKLRQHVLTGTRIQVDSACLIYDRKEYTKELEYNSMQVPAGGEYMLVLSDGTRVWLNSRTKLTYPVTFAKEGREVQLEGEAYFEVERDADRPFLVNAGEIHVRVLGTSFNVKAYGEDPNVAATLVSGSVRVELGERRVLMNPGEQVLYDKESSSWIKREVEVGLYTSWKDGMFKFDRERLENILNTLSRWYGVKVIYSDLALKDRLFSGNLKRYKSVEEVLKVLEMTTKVRFVVNDDTIIVE